MPSWRELLWCSTTVCQRAYYMFPQAGLLRKSPVCGQMHSPVNKSLLNGPWVNDCSAFSVLSTWSACFQSYVSQDCTGLPGHNVHSCSGQVAPVPKPWPDLVTHSEYLWTWNQYLLVMGRCLVFAIGMEMLSKPCAWNKTRQTEDADVCPSQCARSQLTCKLLSLSSAGT